MNISNELMADITPDRAGSGKDAAREFLKIIPRKTGVYIFKDSRGRIIYIGKAKNLYSRVRSYFQHSSKNLPDAKPGDFMNKIKSIDYVVTDNETEALILESSLIKKNKPRYNLDLKDDKSYPFIAVTVEEDFPRVFLTRDRNIAGARYFGPYTDAGAVRKTIEHLRKIFRVRDCKKANPGKGKKIPCLNYHIDLCTAPCISNIKPEEYRKNIEFIILFLKGKDRTVIDRLNSEMKYFSEKKEFENAAEARNKIESINTLYRNQKIYFTGGSKWDFISCAQDINSAVISLFTYRAGTLTVISNFTVENTRYLKKEEIISSFVREYYKDMDDIPDRIFCPVSVQNAELISGWLSEKSGRKIELSIPKIGEKKKIMGMVIRNAVLYMEKKKFEKDVAGNLIYEDLARLKEMLGLKNFPQRIECYDISNLKNTFPAGSMSVAVNGIPVNSSYRHFKIKEVKGQDDCRMIGEVITRRLRHFRGKNSESENTVKDDSFSVKPDLIVIDGGKAQYNTVKRILDKNQVDDIDVISIAKKEETIFCGKYPEGIKLNLDEKGTGVIIKVRDEAHRFAVKYHRKIRGRGMFNSELDGIKGIGEKKKKSILESAGSIVKLKSMKVEDLIKIKELSHRDAVNIYRSIHKEGQGDDVVKMDT
jgi:excinuclease ABC subunit C